MNNKCDDFKDRIAELVGGSLSGSEAQQIQHHINECTECAEFEKLLRGEDELLSRLFSSFDADLERQQQEVIRAIECMEQSAADRIMAKAQIVLDHPIFKITAAAAAVLLVAFSGLTAMGWLYDLQNFMDICTITPK